MKHWKGCPDCRGKGVKPIARGIASCHTKPEDFAPITLVEAEKMVGG